MSTSPQLLICFLAVSKNFSVEAATGQLTRVNPASSQGNKTTGAAPTCFCLDQPNQPSDTLCSFCASLQCDIPNNLPGGWGNQAVIEECRSCSDPFTKDCFCNKKFHPRGCTLRECGTEDGIADPDYVVGYTCYCNDAHHPSDCVSRSNPSHPRCDPSTNGDGNYRDDCQCNSEESDPDNCNIRVCDPDELTGDGYRCICGPRCDQRPDGCVKELKM